jgi:hypothetical protein
MVIFSYFHSEDVKQNGYQGVIWTFGPDWISFHKFYIETLMIQTIKIERSSCA